MKLKTQLPLWRIVNLVSTPVLWVLGIICGVLIFVPALPYFVYVEMTKAKSPAPPQLGVRDSGAV